jgi:esterase/lipase
VKRIAWIISIVFASLLGVFLLGPRVRIDTEIAPIELPEDLDAYLSAQEQAFDDIVPGAEKTIVWAGEPNVKTPLSVVYLHGFSATRQETAPLSDDVAAALGANLYYARFTGHGLSGEALAAASVNDWLNDTVEALAIGRKIGDQVIVIATSTGATAATWLAAQPETAGVYAYVFISPNFAPKDGSSQMLTWPWGAQIATAIIGPERSWEPENEEHGTFWTNRYPTPALLPMMGLVKLARQADVTQISTPTLMLYSPNDDVIDAEQVVAVFEEWGSAEKRLVPIDQVEDPSNHVLAGDILSPASTAPIQTVILEFLANLP